MIEREALREPRPMDAELEGYAWLPRMLDKARAHVAGTSGAYQFGCPVDHTCLAHLGISPELVLDLVAPHPDDAGVLAALRAHGIPPARDAWFDAVAVEDELGEGRYLRVRHRDALPEQDGGRVFAGAEHGAEVSVVLVERPPGEGPAPHAHPTEEVVVVQEGQATFFLGARQARVVRAGEVVRIPAEMAHRYVNTGDVVLRAVAVHGGGRIVTREAAP
jgi:quercetin dioxygenase-like cupin family protein